MVPSTTESCVCPSRASPMGDRRSVMAWAPTVSVCIMSRLAGQIDSEQRTPLQVLLAEDNDDHAELIRRACQRAAVPNCVQRVDDAMMALAFLNRHEPFQDRVEPDIVLLDINLPGMSGHDVLAEIRGRGNAVPVIILSTSRTEDDVRAAYAEHANSYIQKPEQFDELCQLINDLMVYWGKWNICPTSSSL